MPLDLFRDQGPIEPVVDLDQQLPAIDRSAMRTAQEYISDAPLRHAVDVAIYLGLPLLLTGEPGTGKTQLAWRIAAEFGLGEPLVFETKSSSVAQDLLYTFDAVRRFSLAQMAGTTEADVRERALDARRFVRFQALGQAILQANDAATLAVWLPPGAVLPPTRRRSVVLIDEIDKAPRDFPNDLLDEIDRRRFRVAEIGDDYLSAPDDKAPIVLITSNSERQLPDAFLRRCVFHPIEAPDEERLAQIAAARLPAYRGRPRLLGDAVDFFQSVRDDALGLSKKPSTAELLNWLDVMIGAQADRDRPLAAQCDLAANCLGALCKTVDDRVAVAERLAAWRGKPAALTTMAADPRGNAATAGDLAPPAAGAGADDPVADFLAYLGRNGFQTSLRELLRGHELMLALLARGRLPALPAERLALLQPLVCRSAGQQHQFAALLARWSPAPARPPLWRRGRAAAAHGTAAPATLTRWPPRLKGWLAALSLLPALGLVAAGRQVCEALQLCPATVLPSPSRPDNREDQGPGGTDKSETTDVASGATSARRPTPTLAPGHLPAPTGAGETPGTAPGTTPTAFWLNVVGGLAMATLLAMVAMLLLRRLALQPLRTDAQLEQRTLFAPQARLLRKVPPLQRRVSRELRRPRRTDRLELDLGQTIAATVRGGGAFAPRWRARSGTPEYVVLVDQRGPHDQLPRVAEDIVAALDRQGVALQAWRFNGDPSLCLPLRLGAVASTQGPPRRRVRLAELATRSAGLRLLVFADAAQLIDPLHGELRDGLQALQAFGATMLITPMPVPGSGGRWNRRCAHKASWCCHCSSKAWPAAPTGCCRNVHC